MKNEWRYVAASLLTGIVELSIYAVTHTALFGGLGVGMVTFSVMYTLVYYNHTGEWLWTQK